MKGLIDEIIDSAFCQIDENERIKIYNAAINIKLPIFETQKITDIKLLETCELKFEDKTDTAHFCKLDSVIEASQKIWHLDLDSTASFAQIGNQKEANCEWKDILIESVFVKLIHDKELQFEWKDISTEQINNQDDKLDNLESKNDIK